MPSYDGRVSGRTICPLCREVASSEAEMGYSLEGRFATLERVGDVLHGRGSRGEPSSEAEMRYLLEGRFATLERGGDCPAGLGGCEWAARWASLSPFLSSGWEAGRGPSCFNRCLRF